MVDLAPVEPRLSSCSTEFGILVSAEDSPVASIDTSVGHAEAAVEMALRDSEPVTAR
jgi:aspartate/glutamate racemase